MRASRLLLAVIALCVCLPCLAARNHERDPLSDEETNQLRDVAAEPAKKIALYLKFINLRMQNLEHLRSDPHQTQGRGLRIHESLEDFVSLSDEMGDNIDDAAARYVDLRKVLPDVISSNENWRKLFDSLKQGLSSNDARTVADAKEYEFVLTDAFESVQANADTYPPLLEKQKVDMPRLEKEAKEREKRRREEE